MNDWLEVVLAVLRDGVTVHIDLQIRAEKPENMVETVCEKCGKRFVHTSQDAAKRALRAHAQHCTANGEDSHWIADYDQ